MIKRNLLINLVISALLAWLPCSTYALTIKLFDTGGAAKGTPAGDGFIKAAEIWGSLISDPITVNINVGFTQLRPGVLGSASSNSKSVSYAAVRSALQAKKTSQTQLQSSQHLQMTDHLDFITSDHEGNLILDKDKSNNNRFLSVNTANLKALGLQNDPSGIDGNIKFSSRFKFDFNANNTVDSDKYDFLGVALHEIGHTLGFVSGVDLVDIYSSKGPRANDKIKFSDYAIFSVLDLFRYSDKSVKQGNNIPDLAIEHADQYFSLDGGKSNLAYFSTGRYNGDGHQASHWRTNQGLGIMDPTLSRGIKGVITENDLIAFNAIGYNLAGHSISVSLPSNLWLFLVGILLMILITELRKQNVICRALPTN